MHMMGVRGHPEGDTVLSYFTTVVDHLTPLDKAMLHAWYSPRARGGMTPFEMLPILADEMVHILPNQQQALKERDQFLAHTVQEMEAFANGQGDIPMIVKRSGKSTEQGIAYGRMEMSYFLGIAFLEGTSVARDSTEATHWLERAASLGSHSAQVQLGAGSAAVSAAH
jgi:TPR repeat protein